MVKPHHASSKIDTVHKKTPIATKGKKYGQEVQGRLNEKYGSP